MIQPRLSDADDALLVAYVDGALDPEQTARAERLIAADSRARDAVEAFRRTAALLRSACGEEFYPAATPLPAPARRPARRVRAWAAAASVLLVIAGFGAGALVQHTADDDPLAEIAEYHGVFSHETAHLVELPPERVDDMAAWIGEPGRLPAPDLGAASLRLAGGRMLVIDGARVAELMYRRPQGPPLGLCIQRADAGDAPVRIARRGGLTLAVWVAGGRKFTLVGELDAAAARALAGEAAGQAGAPTHA